MSYKLLLWEMKSLDGFSIIDQRVSLFSSSPLKWLCWCSDVSEPCMDGFARRQETAFTCAAFTPAVKLHVGLALWGLALQLCCSDCLSHSVLPRAGDVGGTGHIVVEGLALASVG